MFSADETATIKEKLLQLKTMLPQCELVINSKTYYFDSIELFIHALKTKPFKYRLKIKNQLITDNWSSWLGQTDDYIEAETQGSHPVEDIEWIEINPIEKLIEGESIDTKENDHTEVAIKLLENLTFPYMVSEGIISAYVLKKEI